MIILFILFIIISYIFRSNIIFKSLLFFSSILFLFFILYYLIFIFYCLKNKKKISGFFTIPEEIENSELIFKYKFNSLFFLSEYKPVLITDKSEILFNFDNKQGIFKAIPFYRGGHKIKRFYLQITDPLRFFTYKIKFDHGEFYNFFKFNSINTHQGILPLTNNDIRKFKTMDDSILIRDYLFGDDVRKILWRVYATTDDIKVKTNWLEKTSFNFLPLSIIGLYSENYFFSNLIIYKIYGLIRVLLQNKYSISINGKIFSENDDRKLQMELFKIYEKEEKDGISFNIDPNTILLFSACSIEKNPIKELWIPKNKSIYYVTLRDFFSIDKKKYYNTKPFINLFIKKDNLSKITRFYFSNYFDYDELYEKRYQIL